MRSEIRFAKPGEIPVTISITLSLDEWRKVREALIDSGAQHYTAPGKIKSALTDLTGELDRFVATYEETDGEAPET